jgi:hypothetical protein
LYSANLLLKPLSTREAIAIPGTHQKR